MVSEVWEGDCPTPRIPDGERRMARLPIIRHLRRGRIRVGSIETGNQRIIGEHRDGHSVSLDQSESLTP